MVLAAIPVASQNNGNNQAQAVLHIEVNVVPYAMAPQAYGNSLGGGAVAYYLQPRQPKMSVSEETREFMIRPAAGDVQGHPQFGVLKTVTVVPQ